MANINKELYEQVRTIVKEKPIEYATIKQFIEKAILKQIKAEQKNGIQIS